MKEPRFDYYEGPYDETKYDLLRARLKMYSNKNSPIVRDDGEHFPINGMLSVVLSEDETYMRVTVIRYSLFSSGRFWKTFNQAGLRRVGHSSNTLEHMAGGDLMIHPFPEDST